jgi:hypothetical protein
MFGGGRRIEAWEESREAPPAAISTRHPKGVDQHGTRNSTCNLCLSVYISMSPGKIYSYHTVQTICCIQALVDIVFVLPTGPVKRALQATLNLYRVRRSERHSNTTCMFYVRSISQATLPAQLPSMYGMVAAASLPTAVVWV